MKSVGDVGEKFKMEAMTIRIWVPICSAGPTFCILFANSLYTLNIPNILHE